MQKSKSLKYQIQTKICGLTQIEQAVEIAKLGIDAVGFVFYPKSKRNVTPKIAKKIVQNLPSDIVSVGVFVDEPFSSIMEKADCCHLDAVQLHGNETNELILKLKEKKLIVIKALYIKDEPNICNAKKYLACSYLVEYCKGRFPGGNAISWDFRKAKAFGNKFPFILAGGLNPDNIKDAVVSSMPDAVDVSSGVEILPGSKDIVKVKKFLSNLKACIKEMNLESSPGLKKKQRRVFRK